MDGCRVGCVVVRVTLLLFQGRRFEIWGQRFFGGASGLFHFENSISLEFMNIAFFCGGLLVF